MKNKGKKSLLALVLVALLLTAAVSGTLAYLADQTKPVTNTFTPTQVDIEVQDNYTILNKTGDKNVDAYVRAVVLVNWKNADGDVFGVEPTGHTLKLNVKGQADNPEWVKGNDGFYYYPKKLRVGSTTPALVTEFTAGSAEAPAEGFALTVEILAQAIQAEPDSVVETVWSSGVSGVSNGTLTISQ